MTYIEKMDRYLDSLKVGKSALVDSWFMMSSPTPIVSVVILYVLFVRIGPKLMKNRPPMQMNKLISYYNIVQVLFSLMIVVKALNLNLFPDGILYAGCRYPSNTQNLKLLELGWWYFFAKFTELLDTVFFILRKKDKQVTFLHVWHHGTMAMYAWSYLKFAAGGQGAVLALLNSAVHVVMYAYYFLSGLGPRVQRYLWWKKYVTTMQLIQFVLMLSYCVITHFSSRCNYASGFTYFISGNVTVFLLLFLNFYSKSYKNKRGTQEMKDNFEKETTKQNGFRKNTIDTKAGYESTEPVNGLKDHNVNDYLKAGGDFEMNCKDVDKMTQDVLNKYTNNVNGATKRIVNKEHNFDASRIIKK